MWMRAAGLFVSVKSWQSSHSLSVESMHCNMLTQSNENECTTVASAAPGWGICLPVQEPQGLRFDLCVGKTPWRRARQPTPEFLSGSHGQRSLGHKEWDTVKGLSTHVHTHKLPSLCQNHQIITLTRKKDNSQENFIYNLVNYIIHT